MPKNNLNLLALLASIITLALNAQTSQQVKIPGYCVNNPGGTIFTSAAIYGYRLTSADLATLAKYTNFQSQVSNYNAQNNCSTTLDNIACYFYNELPAQTPWPNQKPPTCTVPTQVQCTFTACTNPANDAATLTLGAPS